jgi:hypothetical protein
MILCFAYKLQFLLLEYNSNYDLQLTKIVVDIDPALLRSLPDHPPDSK